MKTISAVTAFLSMSTAALLFAQFKSPVVVAGGSPTVAPQVYVQYSGAILISYPPGSGLPGQTIEIPGRPPNRVFTNDLGEIGIVWSSPTITAPPPPPVPTPEPAPV